MSIFEDLINEYIESEKKTYTCRNCYGNEELITDHYRKSIICPICGYEIFTFIYNPNKTMNNITYINTIKKKIIQFNENIPAYEQLENCEIDTLVSWYRKIKNIVSPLTKRKNLFINKFLLSKLLVVIDRPELIKYINQILSKSTYLKYVQQWKIICNHFNLKYEMDGINIKKYPIGKYIKK